MTLKDKSAILKTPVRRIAPNVQASTMAPKAAQIPSSNPVPLVASRPVGRRRSEPAWKTKTVFLQSDSGLPAELKSERSGIQRKKQYRKEDIAPTSVQMGIDALDPIHPLTVPFLKISDKTSIVHGLSEVAGMGGEEENERKTVGDVYQSQVERLQTKYTKKIVQTDIAENLFKSNGVFQGDNELVFVQLPSLLPSTPKSAPAATTTTTATDGSAPLKRTWDDEFLGNLKELPGGKLGKLQIFKSGRVKMILGDVTYDVSEGMPCGFLQDLVAIDSGGKSLTSLGEVNKRMVVSLDINGLVETRK